MYKLIIAASYARVLDNISFGLSTIFPSLVFVIFST